MTDARFVLQSGRKTNDPNTRMLIRRHVMLGKNQGRTRTPKQPTLSGCAVFQKDEWERDTRLAQAEVPRRVGSDLAFLEFADAVEPLIMKETFRFCSATDEKLFILEPCVSFNSADAAAMCIQLLASDALHLNIMVFATLMYINHISCQTTSQPPGNSHKATLQHYGQALCLLRKRLEDTEERRCEISDITLTSVMALTMHALVTRDVEGANKHVAGLSKLVSMKENGVHAFRSKTKQMIEILRCDLSVSLASGEMPLFFQDSFREPIFPFPSLAALGQAPGHCPIVIMDSELFKIWDILSRFCVMINEAALNHEKVSDQYLLETMASAMYRLLRMSFIPGSTDETTRLAIVSFCASTLLPCRQLRIPFDWLKLEYKRSVTSLTKSHLRDSNPEVVLWHLMTYIIAFSPLIADECNEVTLRLTELTDLCALTTWDEIKKPMGKFLWIDIVCDYPAKKIVEETLARRTTAVNMLDVPLE